MKKMHKRMGVAIVTVVLFAGLAACEKEGPAERAGKEIDKTVEKAGQQIEKAGQKIEDAAKSATK